jgi:hypothetical protein
LALHRAEITYDQLRRFQEDSVQVIRAIVKAYNKYIPSIMRAAKSDSSILENSITALSNSVTELGKILDSSNLKGLHSIAKDADRLVQAAHELSLKTDEIQQMKGVAKKLQDQEAKLQDDLSSLSRDETIKELNQIEQQARQKETEMLALLEPLLKPLRKIDRADSKVLEGPSRPTVNKVVENPLTAVLEIPVGEMRELLVSVYHLLERDELLLDQRRRRRAAEAIEVLQAGALDRFREEHDILEANRREVLRQLKGSGVYDQWLSVRRQIDDLRKEITECQDRIIQLESQETRLRTSVLTDKQRMESTMEEILKTPVSISL